MNENIYSKTVWVVDDDLPSYQLIEELFSDLDVTLRHFDSGYKLMDFFRDKETPDLVIMDVQLPGVDGLELTRQMKECDPSVPVVAYTSYAMPGDRERCLKSGCNEYISKPIDLDSFYEKVIRYLSG